MNRFEIERKVAAVRDPEAVDYPVAPFAPPTIYPELKGLAGVGLPDPGNRVYPLVRDCLMRLGLDPGRRDRADWNPFRDLLRPGQKVTIKPNLVFHDHPLGDLGVRSMLTHASVIRPLVDYALLATGGDVRITICDAPLQSADFDRLIARNGLAELMDHYRRAGVEICLADIRREIALLDPEGLIVGRKPAAQDPKGYVTVDVARRSAFHPIRDQARRLEITDYPLGSVARHHHDDTNEYLVGRSILDCDLFINVPKLKTHKKAGITGAMKNLIGVNGDKSWIAHHRKGGRRSGGDEFDTIHPFDYALWHFNAVLKRSAAGIAVNRLLRRVYRRAVLKGKSHKEAVLEGTGPLMIMEGSWMGNDTIWRTILDLNSVVLFADREGRMSDHLQREYLVVGDAVLSGEKNGPMEQRPKAAGLIVCGRNPVVLDCFAAALMGFDPHRMPQIQRGFQNEFFPLCPLEPTDIEILCEGDPEDLCPDPFVPPHGWDDLPAPAGTGLLERIAGVAEHVTAGERR